MKINQKPLILLLISLILSFNVQATVFNAISNDDWDEVTTWDQGSLPGILDTVVIDGYTVTIDAGTGNVSIKHLIISNYIGDAELWVTDAITFTVTDDCEAILDNVNTYDADLILQNGAIMNVGGDVEFTRTAANNTNERLLLTIEDASRMNVSGDFTFDYKNSLGTENSNEIFLDDTGILDVTGNTWLYTRGGADFDFKIQGSAQAILRGNLSAEISGGNELTITSGETSHFQVTGNVSIVNSGATTHAMLHADGTDGTFTIGGDLTLNSSSSDKIVYLEATNSNCVFNVTGDISMSALSESDVYIDLKASSNLFLGGDILRPTNYGALLMATGATFTYNGSTPQVLADENLTGSGTDALNFTNLVLDNSSGFTVEDTLHVVDSLILNDGVVTTTSSNIILIGDQATISGGSASAYIDGPLIKSGRTSGSSFLFPVGDGGTYSPMEISSVTTIASQYEVQFFGDPPPFGASLDADVTNISSDKYWTLTKLAGSDDVKVTLHWNDADADNVNDLDSVIVVGLNGSNVWESFGNSGTTGNIGAGSSGSVSSLDGDPPPFGIVTFTLGNTEPKALPVELMFFNAIKQSEKVNLTWKTSSEINTSHFDIEHSSDGINFRKIDSVWSIGDANRSQHYSSFDDAPVDGSNYYRLKIIDEDGSFEYSQTVVVDFENAYDFILYPNPIFNVIYLKGSDDFSEEGQIEVFDINGKLIYSDYCTFENGKFQISAYKLNAKSAGTYFMRISTASNNYILKFNKAN